LNVETPARVALVANPARRLCPNRTGDLPLFVGIFPDVMA